MVNLSPSYVILPVSLLITSVLLLFDFVNLGSIDFVYASESPPFSIQQIIDPDLDWTNMTTWNKTKKGDYSTDIEAVDYYSDGRTLNAILWLFLPFQTNQSNEETGYGMFIDADFDDKTGYNGIEYQYQIGWDNEHWKNGPIGVILSF